MKRPVSVVASLVVAAAATSACGGAKAGKTELTEVCLDRLGGSAANCSCYVEAIERELSPELFQRVAQGAYDNRRYSGMVPVALSSEPAIGSALQAATTACFGTVQARS
jgi:hypothetical protein